MEITNPTDLLDTGIALQVGGEVVEFTATASDAGSGIAAVKFYVDGVIVKIDTSGGPYSYAWDSSTASTGRHVLSVKAIDGVGRIPEESIDVVKI
ncbi:MAG: Ig-like domain-containing protein [Euryarchaeota archaeon]|nr:Ig-like domain-containing protein [Euryarchaeota archaeon]